MNKLPVALLAVAVVTIVSSPANADKDSVSASCGKALEAAKAPAAFNSVARACGKLFNSELQKAWSALGSIGGTDVDRMLADGYAEAYCPSLAKPVTGCNGKKAASFDDMKPAQVLAALSALNGAALDKELGPDKAKPLAAKFDAAWPRLFAH